MDNPSAQTAALSEGPEHEQLQKTHDLAKMLRIVEAERDALQAKLQESEERCARLEDEKKTLIIRLKKEIANGWALADNLKQSHDNVKEYLSKRKAAVLARVKASKEKTYEDPKEK